MIRLAKAEDIPRLLAIYDKAKAFMRRNGNPTQWSGNYPNGEDLLEDIRENRLYALEGPQGLCACFMLAPGPTPPTAGSSTARGPVPSPTA